MSVGQLAPDGVPGLPSPGRCLVMGVLNVTPDSFSDGGRWADPEAAVAHGLRLAADGADLVDVGGESTRPGAQRVDAATEWARIAEVLTGLVEAGVPVSIDTMRAVTAERAVRAGAVLVNDVSGGLADPEMAAAVAGTGAAFVAMHWRGHSTTMNQLARYDDVVGEVEGALTDRLQALTAAGLALERIVLDPGLGFAKNAEHNWALLGSLPRLAAVGRPLLVAASRKKFLGALLDDRPVDQRDHATHALSALLAAAGVWAVRVHDVPGSADAVRVAAAWRAAVGPGSSAVAAGTRMADVESQEPA